MTSLIGLAAQLRNLHARLVDPPDDPVHPDVVQLQLDVLVETADFLNRAADNMAYIDRSHL